MSELVSMAEAARIAGVSRQRMHQLLRAGRIPGAQKMRTGRAHGQWVIPRGSVRPASERPAWIARVKTILWEGFSVDLDETWNERDFRERFGGIDVTPIDAVLAFARKYDLSPVSSWPHREDMT